MPHRIAHVLDTVIYLGSTLIVATSTGAISAEAADSVASLNELMFFLLPFIGAMIVSGCFIMLNPNPDTRKIVIGRAGLALFCGVLVPQMIGVFHPGLAQISLKPQVLVLGGGLVAGLAYVLSKPFVRGLYERADRISQEKLDELEKKYVSEIKGK